MLNKFQRKLLKLQMTNKQRTNEHLIRSYLIYLQNEMKHQNRVFQKNVVLN